MTNDDALYALVYFVLTLNRNFIPRKVKKKSEALLANLQVEFELSNTIVLI